MTTLFSIPAYPCGDIAWHEIVELYELTEGNFRPAPEDDLIAFAVPSNIRDDDSLDVLAPPVS